MHSDTHAYELAINLECRESLHFFTRRMFKARRGYKWLDNWHHKLICDALERVFRGECRRLIINIPPRYSKTEIAVVNFIAWSLGKVPDAEFIHTSYSSILAVNNAFMAKQVVETTEYAAIFPEVALRRDSTAKGDWRTTAGGVVYAQSSGGTITGFGAGKMGRKSFGGCVIIDDPHKADEVRSDVMRSNVIENFRNTIESRPNDPSTPIVVIMQRLHELDLAGFLMAGGNGEKWEELIIPVRRDLGEKNFPAGAPDELWPAKHDAAALKIMEKANPYVFAGQYGQSPAPLAGGEFKPDAIATIEAIPVGTRFVRAWDMAGTAGAGDYTAGGKLGVMPDGRYLIADMARDQLGPDGVEAMMKAIASRDGTGVTVRVPQDPGQAGKAQRGSIVRLLAGYTVISKPVTGDKVTRARPFAAQCNVGNVVMLRGAWNGATVDEMRSFPNGANDDQIDALADAFDELTDNRFGLLDYYKAEAEDRQKMIDASKEAEANASSSVGW